MDTLTETDLRSVMASAAGRHALRWMLDSIRPQVISGPNCAANAALYDVASRIEAILFSLDPHAWTASIQEAAHERLDSSQEK